MLYLGSTGIDSVIRRGDFIKEVKENDQFHSNFPIIWEPQYNRFIQICVIMRYVIKGWHSAALIGFFVVQLKTGSMLQTPFKLESIIS